MMKRKLTEMITRSLAFVLSLGIASGAWADDIDYEVKWSQSFEVEGSYAAQLVGGTLASTVFGTSDAIGSSSSVAGISQQERADSDGHYLQFKTGTSNNGNGS